MRVLFVKDESSMLRGLDAKTKLSVMLVTAVLVVACSGVIWCSFFSRLSTC